jgi:hypothetical protein
MDSKKYPPSRACAYWSRNSLHTLALGLFLDSKYSPSCVRAGDACGNSYDQTLGGSQKTPSHRVPFVLGVMAYQGIALNAE